MCTLLLIFGLLFVVPSIGLLSAALLSDCHAVGVGCNAEEHFLIVQSWKKVWTIFGLQICCSFFLPVVVYLCVLYRSKGRMHGIQQSNRASEQILVRQTR